MLILNELIGEKQAKHPKFFLTLFFRFADELLGALAAVIVGVVLHVMKNPIHLQG
ncbi:MAG: hypothetical protein ACLPND_19105 [Candidatus Korobacteraceae bacterium]